ncbi:glycosyltransferase family 2 protein [Terrisporobacter vanillatitrophus]|uniref:glycosyltransferase family 2 protein n=1 Tax=Terrisporobacter vanillatitrophus TaxID=3058402 RepID=UPI003EB9C3AB
MKKWREIKVMNPKISIIVPVYKVEKYIYKCIDSILAQTFKDFELILVNDGSPDRCGDICEEYARKDDRIVVIHKDNGGQASARNKGIDIARGYYIGFVDSDDWIEPDMYEILYNICNNHNCEIANCSSVIHFKNRKQVNGGHPLTIHTKEEAMKTMLEGKLYDEVVWTKLIKRDLVKGVRFSQGIMYEDTDFTYKVIDKAKAVGCVGEAKYNYIKRDDSTMDRAIKNISIDGIIVYDKMYKFMEMKYPKLLDLVSLKLVNSCMSALNLISQNNQFNSHKEKYYEVSNILKKYYKRAIRIKEYPYTVKILLTLHRIHPIMYKIVINKVG